MRAVLFGDEGVLVDDRQLHLEINALLLREEGLGGEGLGAARLVSETDRQALLRILEREARSSPELLSRLVARKEVYYQERIQSDGYPVVAAARQVIDSCAAEGWMLGVVARRRRAEVDGILAQLGVADRFKTVVTGDDVADLADRSQAWLRAFRDLNARPPLPARLLHPHEVAAVLGSGSSLRAVAELGLLTIGVDLEAESADLSVQRLADLRIADLPRR